MDEKNNDRLVNAGKEIIDIFQKYNLIPSEAFTVLRRIIESVKEVLADRGEKIEIKTR
jgi:hypothetical protein